MPDPAGFEVGDRVKTPANNHATILLKPWAMPLHEFCRIDAGATLWILAELLKPAETAETAMPSAKTANAKRKRKAE